MSAYAWPYIVLAVGLAAWAAWGGFIRFDGPPEWPVYDISDVARYQAPASHIPARYISHDTATIGELLVYTTPAPTPVPTRAPGTLPPAIVSVICAEGTPWPCSWARSTVRCESSGRPGAESPSGLYVGLWQIDRELHDWRFEGPLFDPWANTAVAIDLYNERGPQPWPVCGYR